MPREDVQGFEGEASAQRDASRLSVLGKDRPSYEGLQVTPAVVRDACA